MDIAQLNEEKVGIAVQKEDQFDIPDGGYGWVVVGAFFFASFCCWGGVAGFSIYLAEYIKNNTFNASQIEYAAVGGLGMGSGFLFAPQITFMLGKFGPTIVMGAGAILQFVALLLSSFSTKFWHLCLTQGVLTGVGLAMVAGPGPSIVPQWFGKKRSLAMGIGSAGSGVGGILFNLAMQKIVEVNSVRWALRAQAIICLVINMTCAILMKSRGHKYKAEFHAVDFQLMKLYCFWLHIAWLVFSIFGYYGVQTTLGDATVTLGYSSYQASIAGALCNVGAVVGRPLIGLTADKTGPLTTCTLVYLLCGVFCLAMWIPMRNLATMYAFAFIQGSLIGYIWGAMGAIIPRIVGLKKASVAFGMSWMSIAAAGIVAPIITLSIKGDLPKGVLVDKTRYEMPAVFTGVSFLIASLSLMLLRGYIIARDNLGLSDMDPDHANELFTHVPLSAAFSHSFVLRPKKVT